MIMKMSTLRNLLLYHEDFVSGKSFVLLSNYNKYQEFHFFPRKYVPLMRFLYRKSLFKNVLGQTFFIRRPIFKMFAALLRLTKLSFVPRK